MQHISDSVCAVVPVYNAEKTLCALVRRLTDVLSRFSRFSIVLVDDCSQDSSPAIIRELHRKNEHITGILLAKNAGQQSAVFCGLKYSNCGFTVVIDDDLEQDPEDIIALYSEIKKGYDTVYGVNAQDRQKGFRSLGSRMRDRVFERITDIPKGKKVCSFRIMSKETVDRVLEAKTRFVYISMEILRHTNNIQSIPVHYNPRQSTGYRLWGLARLLIKLYVYYAPNTVFRRLRKYGECCEIKEVIGGNA